MISPIEALYQTISDVWKEDFFLIDSAVKKQGLLLHGKVIEAPDVIMRENIEIVIITFTSVSAGSICRTVAEKYPYVKRILYLGDFLDPNLEL